MMMAQHRLLGGFEGLYTDRLDLANPRGWPEVIANAIRLAEPADGDNFFVVNALAAVAGLMLVRDVALAGNRAKLSIRWHDRSSKQMSCLAASLRRRPRAV